MKGKPKAVWANDGTEHSVIKPLHVYFSEVIFFSNITVKTGNNIEGIKIVLIQKHIF